MYDSNCPSETCDIGVYNTQESAEAAMEKEKRAYSDKMVFEIEPIWGE